MPVLIEGELLEELELELGLEKVLWEPLLKLEPEWLELEPLWLVPEKDERPEEELRELKEECELEEREL